MKTKEIREVFLNFFEEKSHKIVSSAPMVVKNDPTLMFTNAGMNQFKDFFLGYNKAKDTRVANTQKCLRVSGKHNDLEEVGVDTYHHTMFEMLGNWSFGDYFKKEAIGWAWEILTEVYKIDKRKLYVTVFEGDKEDGLGVDQASFDIWKQYIDEDRIILASKKDNFWEMGESGPCGPASEIHVDIRSEAEREKVDGKSLVNADHPQVIEIWNLVFMQYNRMADGSLDKLPNNHVDTGMGLERLAMVMQGVTSNYDTDQFQYLINFIAKKANKKYGASEKLDIAMRVVADHIRAIAFSITDGQLPSNTGAGYVIRRILRRAVRYGYSTLGLEGPFLYELSEKLGEIMGDAFPELLNQKETISKVIYEEEVSFFRTLAQGIKKLDGIIESAKAKNELILDGEVIFELYDTFGFPIDLTGLIARENDLQIDENGFNIALEKQKTRSRAATQVSTQDWVQLKEDDKEEFVGYDFLESDIYITKYREVSQKKKKFYQLVFNLTPFYAQGGGQEGDTGFIELDGEKVKIFDTKKENNLIVHLVDKLPENINGKFKAHVDTKRRRLVEANHSGTHLLHHVLREVLGTHVEQKGSLVNEKVLRFDFSHFSKLSEEEISAIESKVNALIKANITLDEKRNIPIKVAEDMGAMALFGEKYGDVVRVIKFGDSVELCGGTHVSSTGIIGSFKIVTESSVAAGIRRIEAITSDAAELYFSTRVTQFDAIANLFNKPKNLVKTIEETLAKNAVLQKQIDALKLEKVNYIGKDIESNIVEKNGVHFLSEKLNLDNDSIKQIAFNLKSKFNPFVGVFGGSNDGKASLTIIFTEAYAKENDLNAGGIIREAAKLIKGGGGGQPFYASAGGSDANGIAEGLKFIEEKIFGA
ncbi:alanine--tRNA ligase [Putridiphycobacter roseus]|uniref:Alanine--tRNA ligase n=1 Tax=Putridiphycobacter roseus TaxID=2219161 RepID=A0A2W1N9I8_9FLAO|nr:alanine--tRNA ligase [Putridiphycobacter roseus]PZE15703.1 alanine--tRNA ligase [Putridiphycobacter roseus]